MLGLIMNAVVEFVRYKGGMIKREELERAYGSKLEFRDAADYPDEKFQALARSMGEIIGCVDSEERYHQCEREFAKFLFRLLLKRYGALINRYPDIFSFLADLEEIHAKFPTRGSKKIHVINADAGRGVVEIRYVSPNMLDHFLEQMIQEFSGHFGSRAVVEFRSRMSDGAPETHLTVRVLQWKR